MSTNNKLNSDRAISRLRSAAHTGSLRAVVNELATICEKTTVAQCSKLRAMMPRLSVETAQHRVRIGD